MKLYKVIGTVSSNPNEGGILLTVLEIDAEEKANTYVWQNLSSKTHTKKKEINSLKKSSDLHSIHMRTFVLEENIEWAKQLIIQEIKATVDKFQEQVNSLKENINKNVELKERNSKEFLY